MNESEELLEHENHATEEVVPEPDKIYYSAGSRGFYNSGIHKVIPEDAKEISAQEHAELLAEQEAGQVIVPDSEGFPIAAPPPPPTTDQIQHRLTMAVQGMLDAKAQELGFDNIFTAVSYADEPSVSSFQEHGQLCRRWRSLVWAECYTILANVLAGVTPIPTAEELLAQLPQFGID